MKIYHQKNENYLFIKFLFLIIFVMDFLNKPLIRLIILCFLLLSY
jgi:hypothetical protein